MKGGPQHDGVEGTQKTESEAEFPVLAQVLMRIIVASSAKRNNHLHIINATVLTKSPAPYKDSGALIFKAPGVAVL